MFQVRNSAELKLLLTQSCTTALMPATTYGRLSWNSNLPEGELEPARGDSGQITRLGGRRRCQGVDLFPFLFRCSLLFDY